MAGEVSKYNASRASRATQSNPDASFRGDRRNDASFVLIDKDLNRLRRFHTVGRNQFVHFEPMGWSLEVSGIPSIAALGAGLIDEISYTEWSFRHKDADWLSALREDLGRLPRVLANAT